MQSIGVDIIKISHMAEILTRSEKIFLNRVFTKAEQLIGMEHHHPTVYYATIFAAKEAIFKLFSIGWDSGVDFLEIEIYRGMHGEPMVKLSGRFAELSQKQHGNQVLVSLSYDSDTAIAVAALV